MVRPEISELVKLGQFPPSGEVVLDTIKKQDELVRKIDLPLSDDEVQALVKLFGPDDYFGLAWALVHLIEGSPNWPLADCLSDVSNEWIELFKIRIANKANLTPDVNGRERDDA